ncbi:MAG TPA: hypothetical protein VJ643_00920, partial [Nitrososphaera sp.]|nr:hypothetical protein [Nitrososphaera sp.]
MESRFSISGLILHLRKPGSISINHRVLSLSAEAYESYHPNMIYMPILHYSIQYCLFFAQTLHFLHPRVQYYLSTCHTTAFMKNTIKFSIAIAITIAVIASSGAISFPSLSPDTGLGGVNDSGSTNIQTGEQKSLRVGYFPNINHAQAVIGLGNGDFQRALGDNVQVTTQIFNAGPSAIEALFA